MPLIQRLRNRFVEPLIFQTFLLCVVLVALRFWERLRYAHLWAEDGMIFFATALQHGLHVLWHPFAGYHHLLPRAITLLLLQLPLHYFAYGVTAITALLYCMVAARFASTHYAWLVKSRGLRVACAMAFCMAPGMHEVLGNLANLHSVMFLYVGLLILKDPDISLSLTELVALFVAAATEPATVAFVPLFAARPWLGAAQCRGRIAVDLAAVVVLVGWAVANWHAKNAAENMGLFKIGFDAIEILPIWMRWVVDASILQPIFGDREVGSIHRHDAWRLVVYAVPLLMLGVWTLKEFTARQRFLLVSTLSAATSVCILVCVARPESRPVFAGYDVVAFCRYSLAPAPFAFIFWVAILSRMRLPVLPAWWVPSGYVLLYLGLAAYRFKVPAQGPEHDWPATARLLRDPRFLDDPEARVPCNPDGWFIPSRPRENIKE